MDAIRWAFCRCEWFADINDIHVLAKELAISPKLPSDAMSMPTLSRRSEDNDLQRALIGAKNRFSLANIREGR